MTYWGNKVTFKEEVQGGFWGEVQGDFFGEVHCNFFKGRCNVTFGGVVR